MRLLALLSLTLVIACGGTQKKQCFECGLTDEWARAEAAERERAEVDAGPGEEPIAPGVQPTTGQLCGGIAAFVCPDGLACVDDPRDSCDPQHGGADCGGMCVVPGTEPASVEPPKEVSALERLSVVGPVLDGYNRKQWKHWIDADHDCQDTRQEVLIAESQVPVTFKDARHCKVAIGQWLCPYTGETFTDPGKLDVDHMVPLGAAHEAGGYAWDSVRMQGFANELDAPEHLIAVKASANRSKGKKGPDEWLPTNEAYRCQYLRDWISIKVAWKLAVTVNEKRAIQEHATRCGL